MAAAKLLRHSAEFFEGGPQFKRNRSLWTSGGNGAALQMQPQSVMNWQRNTRVGPKIAQGENIYDHQDLAGHSKAFIRYPTCFVKNGTVISQSEGLKPKNALRLNLTAPTLK